MPYRNDEDEENNSETEKINSKKDDNYPLNDPANVRRYGEYKAPLTKNQKLNEVAAEYQKKTTFDTSNPDDIRAFFAGFTVG